MPFNRLMTEFFESSDIIDLIQIMLAHIKTQAENPRMPESGFSLDKIMNLYINFQRLALTQSDSFIELPEWLKNKKAVMKPQDKDEGCFKWAVIAALHHRQIKSCSSTRKVNRKIYIQSRGQVVTLRVKSRLTF